MPGGDAFLGEERNAEGGEMLNDDGFGPRVRLGHRRAVGLPTGCRAGLIDFEDGVGSGDRGLDQPLHQGHSKTTSSPRSSGRAPMVIWLVEM